MKLLELAAFLRGRGHRISVVAPPESPIARQSTAKKLSTFTIEPRFRYLDLIAARKLQSDFRRHRTDIVIAGLSKDISTILLAKRSMQRTSLVFLQQMQFGVRKKDLFHRWAYAGVDLWLTLTSRMRDAVLENTTVNSDKVVSFPIGSDLKAFDPKRYRKEHERKRFHLPARGPIVAVIGRLDPQKGQQHFLRAIPEIRRRIPRCTFVIAGDETRNEPGFRDHLMNLARDLDVDKIVTFLPFTSDVPRLLAAIDLLVLPSLSETFGYVLVEAMAMGTHVIGSRAGGVSEIIDDGTTGFLFTPEDPRDLARKAIRILSDKQKATKIARAAREKARSHYDLRSQVMVLEDLLQKVQSRKVL